MGAKREPIFHTHDGSLVQKQSFLNNFVQDCRFISPKAKNVSIRIEKGHYDA